jgi:hypothetical protein
MRRNIYLGEAVSVNNIKAFFLALKPVCVAELATE